MASLFTSLASTFTGTKANPLVEISSEVPPTQSTSPNQDTTSTQPTSPIVPVSVNCFPHRQCNYSCSFCFHTSLSSTILPFSEMKHGLRLLRQAGMKKINISGGEPFLFPHLGDLIQFCKTELKLESTGIISNGSKVTLKWLEEYGEYLDILGISCDSFDDDTNRGIGRKDEGNLKGVHKNKLNTVVNKWNWEEDMNDCIEEIAPFRWKVFQVLLLEGENVGPNALRNAVDVSVTNEQFQAFLDRHASQKSLVPEDNEAMESSYLLLDEEMRFVNCQGGKKIPGRSLLERGVQAALQDAGWEADTFVARGGVYDWQKPDENNLDW
ncbi:radical SAM enzyme [Pluteus cervinus]|uniref:Radical SAM enzyme n=1 Tax=Pluteus cervinus TaxID=181527 RepID=A0ACD3AZX1_9AGAR|nr:radical SAM enzyme [Pluteus cervinus]